MCDGHDEDGNFERMNNGNCFYEGVNDVASLVVLVVNVVPTHVKEYPVKSVASDMNSDDFFKKSGVNKGVDVGLPRENLETKGKG